MLHLVGCLYYLYQLCTVKQISYNEIYLLIKYIKSVLCRVAKRLSYIEDALCLKVNIFCALHALLCNSIKKILPSLFPKYHLIFLFIEHYQCYSSPFYIWGTVWRSWLRHCTTSRKVAGSIPNVVIGICHRLNSSDRSAALASTHFLTEMSTRDISWGVKVAGA